MPQHAMRKACRVLAMPAQHLQCVGAFTAAIPPMHAGMALIVASQALGAGQVLVDQALSSHLTLSPLKVSGASSSKWLCARGTASLAAGNAHP